MTQSVHGHGSILQPGTTAPEFKLHSTPDQWVSLSDLRGRPVVIAFYPADWSPVCGDEMALYNEALSEFERFDAQLVGISVDSAWCHVAYARDSKLHFPLLADFEPKGEIAKRYGVYDAENGTAERALFVLDSEGTVHWSYLSPAGINPGAAGILKALTEMQGDAQPANEPATQTANA